MTGRRPVRVDPRVFDQIDQAFGPERGPHGEPSAADFTMVDLGLAIEEFATRFDDLSISHGGRLDYRTAVVGGLLIPAFVVTGHLGPDGSIVLLDVQFDLEAGW